MTRWLSAFAALAVLLLIGCGGEGGTTDDTTSGPTTATTAGNTDGGSTSGDSLFMGSFDGAFSGTNTTGATFNGLGGADVDKDGNAFIFFDATVGGAPYSREFEGTISDTGNFTGVTHTGEATTGTVTLNGTTLTIRLQWIKRTASGQPFYTETENFTLTKS